MDVAVIGAGAAGLAAAVELRRRGVRAEVFEARDRVGGRILTYVDPRVPVPIELGAEFVHGEARSRGGPCVMPRSRHAAPAGSTC